MKTLFGFNVSTRSRKETVNTIIQALIKKQRIIREDLNAAKVVWCQDSGPIFESVKRADIVNADGQAIVWAAHLLGYPVIERVTGIDLMQDLIAEAVKHKLSIYLLGAHNSTVRTLSEMVMRDHGNAVIAGFHDGYFAESKESELVERINATDADMLFIGISSPKKEEFILRNSEKLQVRLIMGVGGSFDVLAGRVSRAPGWMQRWGLEWFYRLIQEPGRMWKRYLITNSQFILITIKELLSKGRSIK